jgi:predicted protein tyrosine phosphatase
VKVSCPVSDRRGGVVTFPSTLTRSIITLQISDDYQYMDPELIEILESRLAEYLNLDGIVSADRDI